MFEHTKKTMLYVIFTTTGKEDELIGNIQRETQYKDYYTDIFCLRRMVWKKFKGQWRNVSERMFPGYVFIETEHPKIIQKMCFEMEGFAKVLGLKGMNEVNFIPLRDYEEALVKAYAGKEDHTIDISKIQILEGKKVQIVEGPLLGQEGIIKKINLHKRIAEVEVVLFNQKHTVYLGIEIVRGLGPTN